MIPMRIPMLIIIIALTMNGRPSLKATAPEIVAPATTPSEKKA